MATKPYLEPTARYLEEKIANQGWLFRCVWREEIPKRAEHSLRQKLFNCGGMGRKEGGGLFRPQIQDEGDGGQH